MTQDVEKPRIASATTDPDEHDEIEVTPEMIKAGLHELSFYNRRDDPIEFAEEVVAEIYRAMFRLHGMK